MHAQIRFVAGGAEHLLVLPGQLRPGSAIDQGHQRRPRLPPARVVVVGRSLRQPKLVVVIGTCELGGIDCPPFECEIDLATGQNLHIDAEAGHHLPAQTGDAHLQSFEGCQAFDRTLEPSPHLGAGVACWKAFRAEISEQRVHRFVAAAVVEPGVLLQRGETEGHRRSEGKGGVLAHVVVAGGVAAFHGARLHSVEHLQPRNDLTGGERFDREATTAHGLHPPADGFGASVDGVEGHRPAGRHAPANLG